MLVKIKWLHTHCTHPLHEYLLLSFRIVPRVRLIVAPLLIVGLIQHESVKKRLVVEVVLVLYVPNKASV